MTTEYHIITTKHYSIFVCVAFFKQASDKELIWVLRVTIIAVTGLATLLALTLSSIYTLFVLCSDLVFVLLFPQLICVIHVPKVNTYGLIPGLIIGLFLRLGGGEKAISLPPFIHYPFYNEEKGQLFPFRTLAMMCSLITTIAVSYGVCLVFKRGYLSKKWDVLKRFQDENRNTEEANKLDNKYELVLENREF